MLNINSLKSLYAEPMYTLHSRGIYKGSHDERRGHPWKFRELIETKDEHDDNFVSTILKQFCPTCINADPFTTR